LAGLRLVSCQSLCLLAVSLVLLKACVCVCVSVLVGRVSLAGVCVHMLALVAISGPRALATW
jgi:hypothetical protein